jgi:hemolysin-activating ACP:hemolysin acyltransferase
VKLTVTRIKPLDSAAIAKEKVKKEGDIKKINDEVLQALKNKDYKTFATFIHPKKGITFLYVCFVDPKTETHFPKEDFEKYQLQKHYLPGELGWLRRSL